MQGQSEHETEYVTASEARKRLGVSKGKMARWIKDGTLPSIPSVYNRLVKLVRLADVERIEREPRATHPDPWADYIRFITDNPYLSDESKAFEIARIRARQAEAEHRRTTEGTGHDMDVTKDSGGDPSPETDA